MNEILQQRIEEKAIKYAERRFQTRLLHDLYGRQCKSDFIEGAKHALQNQWISVDEALPEVDGHGYSKPVLVKSDTNELLVATYSKTYNKWNAVDPVSYHRLVITHWMQIPSMEGGEK